MENKLNELPEAGFKFVYKSKAERSAEDLINEINGGSENENRASE